jgi:O-6-methylguanine DNA methyltransferase
LVDEALETIYFATSAAFGGILLAFFEGQLVAAHPLARLEAEIEDARACTTLARYFASFSFLPLRSAPSPHNRASREIQAQLERDSQLPLSALRFYGSPFQQLVWCCLHSIPSGEVRTYAEVAREIGHPKAVRAVANACAKNRLGLVIPCHRVIRSDGSLGGYRWGVELKRSILAREGFAL